MTSCSWTHHQEPVKIQDNNVSVTMSLKKKKFVNVPNWKQIAVTLTAEWITVESLGSACDVSIWIPIVCVHAGPGKVQPQYCVFSMCWQ